MGLRKELEKKIKRGQLYTVFECEHMLKFLDDRDRQMGAVVLLRQIVEMTNPLLEVDPMELHRVRVRAQELLAKDTIKAAG